MQKYRWEIEWPSTWFICPEKQKSKWKHCMYSLQCKIFILAHEVMHENVWQNSTPWPPRLQKTIRVECIFGGTMSSCNRMAVTDFLCLNHTVWGKELDMPLFWAWLYVSMGWWFLNSGKWCFLQRNVQFPILPTHSSWNKLNLLWHEPSEFSVSMTLLINSIH